jgi:hypothetical protein
VIDLPGGASRDRTDDLFHAMEALSQLSYGPVSKSLYFKGNFPSDTARAPPYGLARGARIPEIVWQESRRRARPGYFW